MTPPEMTASRSEVDTLAARKAAFEGTNLNVEKVL